MGETSKIRVMVVDDHPFMRVGVSTMLRSQSDFEVVDEAPSAQEAIVKFKRSLPDVLVLDLGLPDESGLNVIRTLRSTFPQAKIVVLTNLEGDEDIHQALAAGASGYIVKGMDHSILIEAVRKVHRGGHYIPRPIAKTLDLRHPDSDLTPREKEVLSMVVKGFSNKRIGDALGIAEPTVKRHMGAILARLEVTDRTQAVIAALRRGLAHL